MLYSKCDLSPDGNPKNYGRPMKSANVLMYLPKFTIKRDDFDFEIINFPFLDSDVPHSTSYGVYISPLIPFTLASSHVADFNTCIVNSETS